MKEFLKLKKTLINILISFNVLVLYFVEAYWLKDSVISEEGKISTSFSISMVIGASILIFISDQAQWFNWKLYFAIIFFSQLAISLIFKKKIIYEVQNFKESIYKKFYIPFLIYLILGTCLLLYMIFLRKWH